MTPAELAQMFSVELPPETPTMAKACEWCGTRAKGLTRRGNHWTCELCWQGGGGEYPDELALRVSRKMLRNAFAKLPRDRDGRPILPTLGNRAWRKLTGR